MKIVIPLFTIIFAVLATLAWQTGFKPPTRWEGCGHVTYRVQQPLPTPPASFFAQFQPMSINGQPVKTVLVIKPEPVSSLVDLEKQYRIAAGK